MLIIKTVQWNIGGGKLCRSGADPKLLKSYSEDGLDCVIEFLRKHNPDIITLQETHVRKDYCQPQIIAEALGYKDWVNDEWADSHIEAGMRLGQGIVSRFPISDHSFEWFKNPNFEAVWEDGSIARSHDKGRTRCRVKLDSRHILIQTLHTIPFRRFNIEITSPEAIKVFKDMTDKLQTNETAIIEADFNIDKKSLAEIFPSLFSAGFNEVVQTEPTGIRGHHSDHVLYKGVRPIESTTINTVRTDKFPILTTFKMLDSAQ